MKFKLTFAFVLLIFFASWQVSSAELFKITDPKCLPKGVDYILGRLDTTIAYQVVLSQPPQLIYSGLRFCYVSSHGPDPTDSTTPLCANVSLGYSYFILRAGQGFFHSIGSPTPSENPQDWWTSGFASGYDIRYVHTKSHNPYYDATNDGIPGPYLTANGNDSIALVYPNNVNGKVICQFGGTDQLPDIFGDGYGDFGGFDGMGGSGFPGTAVVPDKNLGDGNNPDGNDKNCPVGNPIYPASGNKFQVEHDYQSGGSFPLTFTRYYNSLSTQAGSVGNNWSHNFSAHLQIVSSNVVKMIRGDQKTFVFTLNNNVWKADADVTAQLTKTTGLNDGSVWQYTTGDNQVEFYDATGKLLFIEQLGGFRQTLSYDSQNRLQAVTDAFGRSLNFIYDSNNRIKQLLDSANYSYQYDFDANNRLVAITYPNAALRRYVYENTSFPNALTGIIDENGVRYASFSYNLAGKASSSEHIGGVDKVSLNHDFLQHQTTVTGALGAVQTLTYQTILGIPRQAQASEQCASCSLIASNKTYDFNGNVTSLVDFNGNKTSFVYDSLRNLETSRTEAVGSAQARTISTEWHSVFRLPTKITEANRVTTLSYDNKGNLLQKTLSSGNQNRIWRYSYNSFGQITQINGPRNDVQDTHRYSYDANGNLSTITNPLRHVTQLTDYDKNGRPQTIIDANGLTTHISYDFKGRITTREIDGETTTYSYDNVGQLVQETHPDGRFIAYSYDQAHRLKQISDGLGNTIMYTLDAQGNQTAQQVYDSNGILVRTRTQEFDTLSRLAKSIDAYGQATSYGYDSNSNLTTVTDALNNTNSQQFDALNRLIASIDPLASKTEYQYDIHNNPTQVKDPRGASTHYLYDGLDNNTQIQSPDTGTTQNRYDEAGNLISSTDARGKTTRYSYDGLNRITRIRYAGGMPVSFIYDKASAGKGRLIKMTDETGSTQWTYDLHGRVLSKTQSVQSVMLTTAYSYDADGKLTQITYPSGKVINVGYDANGQVMQLALGTTPIVQNIDYAAFASAQSWLWGNNQAYTRTFDQNGRLISYPLGERARNLTYNAAGQITDYIDTNSSFSQHFDYDVISRLVSAAINSGAGLGNGQRLETFSYDENGNRIAQTIQNELSLQTTLEYTSLSNRLTQVTPQGQSPTLYQYDKAGNTLNDGLNTYSFNDRGRLASANTTQYSINGLGQRVKKTGTLANLIFVYDEAGHLMGEYDNNGVALREIVYLGDAPVAAISGNAVSYIHVDHLNTPRAIVNANGKTIWRWDAEPFGADKPNEDPDGDGNKFTFNLRFPGQYYDAETGLHYNYFRDYDPRIGRYIESDPIGLLAGVNPYNYVYGNPVYFVDVDGKNPIAIASIVINGVAGMITGGVGAYLQGGSISEIAIGALYGGATGAVIGLINPLAPLGILGTGLATGFTGGVGDIIGQKVAGKKCIDWEETGLMAGTAAMGGAASAIGGAMLLEMGASDIIASGFPAIMTAPPQLLVSAAANNGLPPPSLPIPTPKNVPSNNYLQPGGCGDPTCLLYIK